MAARDGDTAILLFAHGSRVADANQGVHDLARRVQDAGPYQYVRAAFLDLAQPDLNAAVAAAVQAGMRRVIVIPFFLMMGVHLRRDLPKLIEPLRERFPDLAIDLGQSLEDHPMMPSIILGRVQEATKTSS